MKADTPVPGQPGTGRRWIRHRLGFAAIALLFIALVAYELYDSYRVATAGAIANVNNLSRVLESNLEHALMEAQSEVVTVATDIDPQAMRPADAARHRPLMMHWLNALASHEPNALALRVFDAKGDSLYSSDNDQHAFNIADREYFRQVQANPSISVLFSKVIVGRLTGQPAVFAVKAVRDRGGAFLGVAVNGVELSSLQRYFSTIELGSGGAIAVRRLDTGAYVVRYPGTVDTDNKPALDLPMRLALLKDGRPGTSETPSPIDGIRRIYSYRKIGDFPFYVVIGASPQDYLAGWRQTASITLLISFLFLAILATVFSRLARAEARREGTMALLEASQSSLLAAQEIASLGQLEYDFATDRWTGSSILDEIFGIDSRYPRDSKHWLELACAESRPELRTYFNAIVAQGLPFDREYRIVRPRDAQERWVHAKGRLQLDENGLPLSLFAAVQDITERKMAQDQIHNLAFSDPLTQLPNRRLLMDRLQHALSAAGRHQRNGALLLIDLDDFKTLNDTRGHDKGDLMLQQVAKRLTACIREGDTLARASGDEFIVLLEDLSKNAQEAATEAKAVGKKMLASLHQTYELADYSHRGSASIGIALFGEQQDAIAEPLKRAELAMYQAKAAGRNTLRFFDPEMQAVVTTRAALETGLLEAMEKDQFLLHYQAQVGADEQITGMEALVRWQDPLRGMVMPAEFIALAEETGLILPLGQWVLETACKQLALWARRPALAHLTIAVNVSARQFHQSEFVDQVLATLKHTGANPHRLKLELTESLLVSNIEGVIAKMSALKRRGVGFSLDDFGTGYSSLSYLKRLPLDQLKIDQGFVRDILVDANDAAIAKMVVALADSMGLAVIAEGVETPAQRDFLEGLGCHAYQGYLFSRPLPLEEFEAFVLEACSATPNLPARTG